MIGFQKLCLMAIGVCLVSVLLAGCGADEKSAESSSSQRLDQHETRLPAAQAKQATESQPQSVEQSGEFGGDFEPDPETAAAEQGFSAAANQTPNVQGAEGSNDFPDSVAAPRPEESSSNNTVASPILSPPRQQFRRLPPPEPSAAESDPTDTNVARGETAVPRAARVDPPPVAAAPEAMGISEEPAMAAPAAPEASHLDQLPAGSAHSDEDGYATVQVYYATDRNRVASGTLNRNIAMAGLAVILLPVSLSLFWYRKPKLGIVAGAAACGIMFFAQVQNQLIAVKQHEVAYDGQRGELVRGVCSVTVPDTHQKGVVERPSLLKFEFKEDQQKHVVLTDVSELDIDDYYSQLQSSLAQSPDNDLLVFIHGFNVDFETAVRRTAQIAVDLPFRGVPICYSWPSQGSLVGYTVDENNAAWTAFNLRQFLLEIAEKSGARSINVVAHSMGNRAMTAALSQISIEVNPARSRFSTRLY